MSDTDDSLETSLQFDDVRITRYPVVSDDVSDAIPADAFQEMEIEIPLRGEEISVSKRPVIRESVVVTKRTEERLLPVRSVIRSETLSVDDVAVDAEPDNRH